MLYKVPQVRRPSIAALVFKFLRKFCRRGALDVPPPPVNGSLDSVIPRFLDIELPEIGCRIFFKSKLISRSGGVSQALPPFYAKEKDLAKKRNVTMLIFPKKLSSTHDTLSRKPNCTAPYTIEETVTGML